MAVKAEMHSAYNRADNVDENPHVVKLDGQVVRLRAGRQPMIRDTREEEYLDRMALQQVEQRRAEEAHRATDEEQGPHDIHVPWRAVFLNALERDNRLATTRSRE
jgi:hypothetical protein